MTPPTANISVNCYAAVSRASCARQVAGVITWVMENRLMCRSVSWFGGCVLWLFFGWEEGDGFEGCLKL